MWVSQQASVVKVLFFSCGAGFGAAVCSLGTAQKENGSAGLFPDDPQRALLKPDFNDPVKRTAPD